MCYNYNDNSNKVQIVYVVLFSVRSTRVFFNKKKKLLQLTNKKQTKSTTCQEIPWLSTAHFVLVLSQVWTRGLKSEPTKRVDISHQLC